MSVAEQKYDLALVKTLNDKKIREKPCEFEESLDKLEDSVSGSGMSGSCEQPPPSARDSSFSQTSEYSTVEEKIYPSPQIKTNVFDMDVMFEKFDDPFLWYKERLQTSYIKSLKPSDTNKNLMGKNWLFLKDGLDDFRDGLPPPVDGDVTLKNTKGPGPAIKNSSENLASVKQPAVKRRFNKDQICFSRLTPLQQQRREHINEIEYGLTQHPLALYPHLEESVNPELFEDIMNILDPEMNFVDDEEGSLAEEDEEAIESDAGSSKQSGQKDKSGDDRSELRDVKSKQAQASSKISQGRKGKMSAPKSGGEEGMVRNPYKWISKREEEKKKEKKKAGEKPQDSSQEEHIKNVTKEFCDWVASLGGDSNNIEESTITSLFASGYETKPALSVPIHVVELTNVPPELRMSATVPQQQQQSKNLPQEEQEKTKWQYSGNYEPSWIKFKYGAWYLDPKTWQKRDTDQPLMDPKALKDQEMSEAKKKSKELNYELATMHGVNLFKDFMDKKQRRKPEFLDEVDDIQKKAAEEEQRRIEAELAAKKKRSHIRKKQEGEEIAA